MTFLVVDNLRSDRSMHDSSMFPTISHKEGEITFLAYLPLEYDMSKLSTYSNIKVHPIHTRDTSIFENMFELGKKNNYVILTVNQAFSSVLLYVPSVSKTDFRGTIEVILKNDASNDQEYVVKFPGRSSVDFRLLTDKMNTVYALIIKDYIEYLKSVQNSNSDQCKLRIVKGRSPISHFPKELIKVEAIAKPIVTPAAAAGARPAVSGSEKKGFLSKLFS